MKKLITPLIAAVAIALLTGCGVSNIQPTTSLSGNDSESSITVEDLFAVVDEISEVVENAPDIIQDNEITETAPVVGEEYQRSYFGKSWKSIGNGCNFRQVVLSEQMDNVTFVDGSTCKVQSGTFTDPYTGQFVEFTRDNPDAVPVDHIVSLSEAWELGAKNWTFDQRVEFANDIENLTITTQQINSWKSDKSLSEVIDCVSGVKPGCAPKTQFVGQDFFASQYAHIINKYGLN